MKCLPHGKIAQANGIVLHDWHAEVLAIRAFNHFLVQECDDLAKSAAASSFFIRRREEHEMDGQGGSQPFTIRDDVQLHMYCSEAPCGDASMENTMDAQKDATPWPDHAPSATEMHSQDPILHGRGYFSQLGIVRRKPCMCGTHRAGVSEDGS